MTTKNISKIKLPNDTTEYVLKDSTVEGTYLPVAGGTMQGNIDIRDHGIGGGTETTPGFFLGGGVLEIYANSGSDIHIDGDHVSIGGELNATLTEQSLALRDQDNLKNVTLTCEDLTIENGSTGFKCVVDQEGLTLYSEDRLNTTFIDVNGIDRNDN